MLTSVRLKDFKNHVDTRIRLGRLTCLVGPNGCGKTSVLEAIQFALASVANGPDSFFQGFAVHGDYYRKGLNALEVEVSALDLSKSGTAVNVELMLEQATVPLGPGSRAFEPPGFHIKGKWRTELADKGFHGAVASNYTLDTITHRFAPTSGVLAFISDFGLEPTAMPEEFRGVVPASVLFSFDMAALRSPCYSSAEVPSLSAQGAGLGSVIAYLTTAEPDRFAELTLRIREVLPFVERLRVRPAKVQLTEPTTITVNRKEIPYSENREVIGHELLFDLKGAPGVPARAVSEGTLLVTALLTATVWNQGADILLIDDLEKGLHPKAQRELVQALKALLDTDPKLQVAFSTHSPYVVDELQADQVCILVPDEVRGVVARRLSDHPRAEDALKVLTTGEFLSAEGEDWVRDLPPPPDESA